MPTCWTQFGGVTLWVWFKDEVCTRRFVSYVDMYDLHKAQYLVYVRVRIAAHEIMRKRSNSQDMPGRLRFYTSSVNGYSRVSYVAH